LATKPTAAKALNRAEAIAGLAMLRQAVADGAITLRKIDTHDIFKPLVGARHHPPQDRHPRQPR